MGAHRYDRLTKVILSCVSMVTLIGLAVTTIIYTIGPNLLSLYVSSSDPDRDAVLAAGMVRLKMVAIPYFLCGIMEVLTGALRGLGKAWTPLIISLLGSCVFRVLWVYTVFAAFPQLEVLYASYPISWFITPLMQSIALFSILRKQPKRDLSNHQKGAV